MAPHVTAVVLNWCREGDTAACVESLLASDHQPLSILIVDNASPDGSGERLHRRFPALPYLQTPNNLGYAGGNNRGIEWALKEASEFVLVVNDDAVVERHCISTLVGTAERTGAGAVGPQIRYFAEPEIVACGAGRFSRLRALGIHTDHRAVATHRATETVTFVSGCCVLLRADALRAVGLFDESFFAYVEDAELSFRLTKSGLQLVYEPEAQVWHKAARGAPETPFQIRLRDRNRRRLATRHYGFFWSAAFRLWFYPSRAVIFARYVVHRDWARAAAVARGAFSR